MYNKKEIDLIQEYIAVSKKEKAFRISGSLSHRLK